MNIHLVCLVVCTTVLFPVSSASSATFRNVVDSAGAFEGFTFTGLAFPSLNNNQQLTFEGQTTSGVHGIFLADLSGPAVDLTVLVDTSGPYADFDSFYNTTNDDGLVAVHALRDDGEKEIFTVDATGTVTPLVDTTGVLDALSTDMDMNNSGTVAFVGSLATGERGIYTASGNTAFNVTTTISDHTGEFEFVYIPSINDDGDVLFLGSDTDAEVNKLVVDHPGATETIAGQVPFGTSLLPYALNNPGDVAYYRPGASPAAIELFHTSDSSVNGT